jgi:dinuclear metal center YbgI/SA1388 family protein
MIFRELRKELNKLAPEEISEEWDNPGIQCGNPDKDIKKIALSLDADSFAVDFAIEKGCDLLLTHHPLIFPSVSHIDTDDFIGKRLYRLIRNDIILYSCHTDFDKSCMTDAVDDRLGLIRERSLMDCGDIGMGSVGIFEEEMTLSELSNRIMDRFGISNVRIFGDPDHIVKKAAVLGGSGKSEIDEAIRKGADTYITGDIDHHSGIDAVEKGLNIIDAGHFGIEHIFSDYMADYFKDFPEFTVLKVPSKEPFIVLKEVKK